MSDPKAVKKGGFGAFTAMERDRKAARELAERANAIPAATAEPTATIVTEPASVPWPRPYSLRAEADGDASPGTGGLAPHSPR